MRWRWLIGAGVALLIFLLIRSVNKPNQPKLHEIRWRASAPIAYTLPCDLDGDGDEEVIAITITGECQWLKPSFEGWKAERLPIKAHPHSISFYWALARLHYGVLVIDTRHAISFLFYRNGWRWQKLLDAPVQDFKWLDLDGDGKVNDVLVLKEGWVWWFKIGDDGRVILQDKQRMPGRQSSLSSLESGLFGFGFWSEKGKLVISPDWERREIPQLDWDGDGLPEIVHYNTSGGNDKLIVQFSRTGEKRRIYLVNSPTSPTYIYSGFMVAADLEGKGKRELATIAKTGRIILIDEQGQWRPTPCRPVYAHHLYIRHLWVTRRGEKDWIWAATPRELWLLRYNGKGYQVRQWRFEGDPLAVWQDKQGLRFAFCSSELLAQHPFGRWAVKASNWLHSLGIPIHIQQVRFRLHLWKWDEHKNDWQQVKRIRIPTRLRWSYLSNFNLLDLNSDEQNECVLNVSNGSTTEIWLFTGQWHFIGKNWQVPILRDGQRRWVVGIDDKDKKVLRGLTLTDFDVKSSDGR